MARYKYLNRSQTMLVPVDFTKQILPGSFEAVLDRLMDRHVSGGKLDERYRNDETGAPAYDPRVLLKIILYAYSRGIQSSREIEEACRTNVTFMALSGCATPDFSTIANFVSSLADDIERLFADVLAVCLRLGLVGGRMLAIDGCKLPSNASREWSGTHTDLAKKRDKLKERMKRVMIEHRRSDRRDRRVERIKYQIRRIDTFLHNSEPRMGKRGNEVQSNVTDNESAKMKSARGMIQGYNGIALVDEKHQIVLTANAFGSGPEQELLQPTVESFKESLKHRPRHGLHLKDCTILADTGYFGEDNLAYLEKQFREAIIPDPGYRRRDPRFATAGRYKNRIQGRVRKKKSAPKFTEKDFRYDRKNNRYICPAGRTLRQTRTSVWIHDANYRRYVAKKSDCSVCPLRNRCLANSRVKRRNLHVINRGAATFASRMVAKIDTPRGKKLYSHRMGIVEPVFANVTFQKGLNRFTLRGRRKGSRPKQCVKSGS